MAKFKIGQKVRIIDNLIKKDHFPRVTPEMCTMEGKEYTIIFAPSSDNEYYKLKEDKKSWNWDEDWLEEPYPEPQDIKESELLSIFGR